MFQVLASLISKLFDTKHTIVAENFGQLVDQYNTIYDPIKNEFKRNVYKVLTSSDRTLNVRVSMSDNDQLIDLIDDDTTLNYTMIHLDGSTSTMNVTDLLFQIIMKIWYNHLICYLKKNSVNNRAIPTVIPLLSKNLPYRHYTEHYHYTVLALNLDFLSHVTNDDWQDQHDYELSQLLTLYLETIFDQFTSFGLKRNMKYLMISVGKMMINDSLDNHTSTYSPVCFIYMPFIKIEPEFVQALIDFTTCWASTKSYDISLEEPVYFPFINTTTKITDNVMLNIDFFSYVNTNLKIHADIRAFKAKYINASWKKKLTLNKSKRNNKYKSLYENFVESIEYLFLTMPLSQFSIIEKLSVFTLSKKNDEKRMGRGLLSNFNSKFLDIGIDDYQDDSTLILDDEELEEFNRLFMISDDMVDSPMQFDQQDDQTSRDVADYSIGNAFSVDDSLSSNQQVIDHPNNLVDQHGITTGHTRSHQYINNDYSSQHDIEDIDGFSSNSESMFKSPAINNVITKYNEKIIKKRRIIQAIDEGDLELLQEYKQMYLNQYNPFKQLRKNEYINKANRLLYLNMSMIRRLWNDCLDKAVLPSFGQVVEKDIDIQPLINYMNSVTSIVIGKKAVMIYYKTVTKLVCFDEPQYIWDCCDKNVLKNMFSGMYINKCSVFDMWFSRAKKRTKLTFNPTDITDHNDNELCHNIFNGLPINKQIAQERAKFADQSYIDDFMEIIYHCFCRETDSLFLSFMNIVAAVVQNPGYAHPAIILLKGDQSMGKTTIMAIILSFFGVYSAIDKFAYGKRTFNGMEDKLMVILLEEFLFAKDINEENYLKALTTNTTRKIHPKFIDEFEIENYITYFATCDVNNISVNGYIPTDIKRIWLFNLLSNNNILVKSKRVRKILSQGMFEELCAIYMIFANWEIDTQYLIEPVDELKVALKKEISIASQSNLILNFWHDCCFRGYHVKCGDLLAVEKDQLILKYRWTTRDQFPCWYDLVPLTLLRMAFLLYLKENKIGASKYALLTDDQFLNETNNLFKINFVAISHEYKDLIPQIGQTKTVITPVGSYMISNQEDIDRLCIYVSIEPLSMMRRIIENNYPTRQFPTKSQQCILDMSREQVKDMIRKKLNEIQQKESSSDSEDIDPFHDQGSDDEIEETSSNELYTHSHSEYSDDVVVNNLVMSIPY